MALLAIVLIPLAFGYYSEWPNWVRFSVAAISPIAVSFLLIRPENYAWIIPEVLVLAATAWMFWAFDPYRQKQAITVRTSEESSTIQKPLELLVHGLDLDVVGESFYSENYELIRKTYGKPRGSELLANVELHSEPWNELSPSRKAVSVQVDGFIFGHIPEGQNQELFDFLESHGGALRCRARFWFARRYTRPMRNSITLQVKIPFEIE